MFGGGGGGVKGTGDGLNLERLALVVGRFGCFHGPSCRCKFPHCKSNVFFFKLLHRTGELPYSKCFSFLIIYQSK